MSSFVIIHLHKRDGVIKNLHFKIPPPPRFQRKSSGQPSQAAYRGDFRLNVSFLFDGFPNKAYIFEKFWVSCFLHYIPKSKQILIFNFNLGITSIEKNVQSNAHFRKEGGGSTSLSVTYFSHSVTRVCWD